MCVLRNASNMCKHSAYFYTCILGYTWSVNNVPDDDVDNDTIGVQCVSSCIMKQWLLTCWRRRCITVMFVNLLMTPSPTSLNISTENLPTLLPGMHVVIGWQPFQRVLLNGYVVIFNAN